MISGLKVLALIPARGGSRGIINKNTTPLCGKPLIAYTIDAATGSRFVDDVIVTTDSRSIADVSLKLGAEIPFMRPRELSGDTSKTVDCVIHALTHLEMIGRSYDVLILLQPTQPLRTSSDIDASLSFFVEKSCRSVVSVSPVETNPILIRSLGDDSLAVPLLKVSSTCRRQDMKPYYRINGCIYINKVDEVTPNTSFNDNMYAFVMDASHSVDIDEAVDLKLAEYYINGNSCKK